MWIFGCLSRKFQKISALKYGRNIETELINILKKSTASLKVDEYGSSMYKWGF